MNEKQLQTSGHRMTTATRQTRQAVPAAYDLLEPAEEKVIRMIYGLSEDDSKRLEFAVGASADSKLKMAIMEANNIDMLDADVPMAGDAAQDDLLATVSIMSE